MGEKLPIWCINGIDMKKIALILLPLLFLGLRLVSAENYYYIPDHKLETPSIFCVMEFEDEIFFLII